MKKLGVLLFLTLVFNTLKAQKLRFLNYSICSPPGMNSMDEANSYMQGGGHDYYLSYSLSQQINSFGPAHYPYGSDNDPIIIYVDSTQKGVYKQYFKDYESSIYKGQDWGKGYTSPGLWPDYSEKSDIMIGPELPYKKEVLQCVSDK